MAIKRSKRYEAAAKLVDRSKVYSWSDAVKLLKTVPATKGDQTVDLAFKLGVDPKQSDQMVRGTVALPAGSGKNVRVLVFAKGAAAEAAKAAGAEFVGFEDLIKKVTEGWQDFDVAVATTEAMGEVRKLGRVLGPRGLMPNPKTGTVTDDTAKAVRECKAGRVEFKLDKAANLHVPCGKFSFNLEDIEANGRAVIEAIIRSRPATAKGRFIESVTLSSTYSPGIRIDITPFLSA
jgi:large subunit ribosomal protein L1